MSRFAIAAYRPRPGQEANLLGIVKKHTPLLRSEDLITDHPTSLMRAQDGTLVEIFVWRSPESMKQAHENQRVQILWEELAAVCDFTPLKDLAEAQAMFADFEAIQL